MVQRVKVNARSADEVNNFFTETIVPEQKMEINCSDSVLPV